MFQSVYINGVTMYARQDLEGKVGRVAMEMEMIYKLQLLGYAVVNGINLTLHMSGCESLYADLKKQLDILRSTQKKGGR